MFDLIIKICKGYKLNVIEVLTPSWLIGGQSRSKRGLCSRKVHSLYILPQNRLLNQFVRQILAGRFHLLLVYSIRVSFSDFRPACFFFRAVGRFNYYLLHFYLLIFFLELHYLVKLYSYKKFTQHIYFITIFFLPLYLFPSHQLSYFFSFSYIIFCTEFLYKLNTNNFSICYIFYCWRVLPKQHVHLLQAMVMQSISIYVGDLHVVVAVMVLVAKASGSQSHICHH